MKSLANFAVFALSIAVSAVVATPAQAVTTDDVMAACNNYAIANNYFMKQRQNNVPKTVVQKEFNESRNATLEKHKAQGNPQAIANATTVLNVMEGYMNSAYNAPIEKTSAKKRQVVIDNHLKIYKFCMGKAKRLVK